MISKLIRWPLLAAIATLALSSPMAAQQPAPAAGRIIGRVLDAATGNGLSAVTVQIVGTNLGAISGLDGRFIINQVPEGSVTLRATSIGYAEKTVNDVEVAADKAVEQNISLQTEAVMIGALEVTAAAERGSVNRALDQQRTATGIVNAVTSEQITRSPDSDAAQAVQRVSGVTVQDNKFVIVRGLGERYTTTSLNGARIPSPEPEKKIVPLDLFPTNLLEQITTSKTFTPDQPADFSGAQVNITLREFPVERTRTVSTSFGWNHAATGQSLFMAPTVGGEWLAVAGNSRAVPDIVRAAGRFAGNISQPQMNQFVNSFRNAWAASASTGAPAGSFSFTLGGNDPVFGQRVGYLFSGSYSYGQDVRSGEVRALAQPSVTGGTEEIDRYSGLTGRSSVLWGGLFSASTLIGGRTRLALSTTYNRSADNEARQEAGTSEQFGNLPLEVTRLRYIERDVGSIQLLGEHEIANGHRLNWAVSGSQVNRDEPDRSEFVYATPSDPATGAPLPREWFATAAEGAVRTYADLNERALEAKADYRLDLGRTQQNYIKFGGLVRGTNRAANTYAYSIIAPTLPIAGRRLSAEEIFDGRFSAPEQTYFQVRPMSQGGSYQAKDHLFAGYLMTELGLTDRIRLITGARIERSTVDLTAAPTLGAAVNTTPAFTDVLPSIALNVALSESQNLRLSASQTLSRPEYRELAPVMYRDVIGAENVRGNPDLRRALIRNFDVRWELYPGSGEVLSVALFGKLFEDPIERIYLGTSGTKVVTFLNAKGATNYGVELEARKRLGFIAQSLHNLTGFVNATLMKSEIEIGAAGSGASRLNDKRPMVGQSPYVLNAGLTYASARSTLSVTALYNIFGKRIV
ncbi:MAG TPA: TonB-dependent receptor, partial [Longimicrobiales bacterium]